LAGQAIATQADGHQWRPHCLWNSWGALWTWYSNW